jgi:hypothetical protein
MNASRARPGLAQAASAAVIAAAVWGALPRGAVAADDVAAEPLEFVRVHVPAGRLADVPLGDSRYVPMSAREFEAGIARIAAGTVPAMPPASRAIAAFVRYDLHLDADGGLAGRLTAEVGGMAAPGIVQELSLGAVDVRSGATQFAAGRGEAVVFGRADGTLAVAIPQPGTYTCAMRVTPPGDAERHRLLLPLAPALAVKIVVDLPAGLRPVAVGLGPLRQEAGADEGFVRWQIETGPLPAVEIVCSKDTSAPLLTSWGSLRITGRQTLHDVLVRPTTPWGDARLRLEKSPELLVTRVVVPAEANGSAGVEAVWTEAADRRSFTVLLPAASVGTRSTVLVMAVAPIAIGSATLPRVQPPAASWAGGGIGIEVDPAHAVDAIHCQQGMVVPPEVAAHWPLPQSHEAARGVSDADAPRGRRPSSPGGPAVEPARFFVEEQAAQAAVTLALATRTAVLDVARVTTVELAAGLVVGRAACDVRVLRGEAFDLSARVTPGWFIDSVERFTPSAPDVLLDAGLNRGADDPVAGLDWRVQRDGAGDVLRIGLAAAATPDRSLALRITGHRAGLALGEVFTTGDLDMVRLEGEGDRTTLLDLRMSPEATLEFDAERSAPSAPEAVPAVGGSSEVRSIDADGRLAALVEEGAVRARLPAGVGAASATARLVRRRPPLDARAQVRLTVRDDRLVESFTFECAPTAADLDSIIVRFSEPLDQFVEWSLLPPAVGTVTPRRLEPTERRGGGGEDRWLLELSPPARGPVTVRGHRTVPFMRPVPVPLVWVEGSTSATSQLFVRSIGRARPMLVNRRLAELPPEPGAGPVDAFTIAEFSYAPSTADGPGGPAAELVPAAGEARAWAWRERTISWSHTSGMTEHETRFDIENHGRDGVSISLPPGRQVQAVLIDGERLSPGDRAAAGGELRVVLPAGRTRIALVVRSVTDRAGTAPWRAASGWPGWSVEAPTVAVDVPVLDRDWLLMLPPELELALVGGGMRLVEDGDDAGWTNRLLGAGLRAARGAATTGDGAFSGDGWRRCRMVPAGGGPATAIVARTRAVATCAAVLGIIVGAATLWLGAVSGWAVLVACLLAGVTALWAAAPFDLMARAVWWATVTAAVASWAGMRPRTWPFLTRSAGRVIVALGVVVAAGAPARADEPAGAPVRGDAAGPLKVFIAPPDPGGSGDATVLVPQPLFRAIVRGEDSQPSALRLRAVTVTAAAMPRGDAPWEAWRLTLEVDADAGGELALEQPPGGGRFLPATLRVDGVPAVGRPPFDAGRLRVACAEPGRHLVTVDLAPDGRRDGDIETVLLALPPSAAATLEIPAADAAVIVDADTAAAAGEFRAVVPLVDGTGTARFDLALARRVRVRRSLAAHGGLVAAPPTAESRNDVAWGLDACRVHAVFEVDAGADILPGCVVQADPGLEWSDDVGIVDDGHQPATAASDVLIQRLGGGRYRIDRRHPERGRFRFEMAFRMALPDAVGVFEVPGAWLENATHESRVVRFAASESLAVRIDLPPGLAHISSPDGESSFETRFWRGDSARPGPRPGAVQGGLPTPFPRARLQSERRRQELRGSQRESIVFAADQVRIALDARLDASAAALAVIPLEVPPGCVIDRVALFEDDLLQPDTADRDALDTRCSRISPTMFEVVVQQPRAGRFRLDVAARIPVPPPPRGPLPCLRVQLADGGRTHVEWRAEAARQVEILPPQSEAPAVARGRRGVAGQCDLVAGDAPPEYALEAAAAGAAADSGDDEPDPAAADQSVVTAITDEQQVDRAARVDLADVRLVIDDRGRAWGLAAFDLVATEEAVHVALPRSWRLYDAMIDGRPADGVAAQPGPDNVWSVPLLDAGWPRSLVVLFAGEFFAGEPGRRLLDGEPLELSAPAIVGLTCRRLLWTLLPPPGIALRVAAPARIVSADVLEGERDAARERLLEDFELAARRMANGDPERLRRFARERAAGGPRSVDDAWNRAWEVAEMRDRHAAPMAVVAATEAGRADARLVIRAVRPRDGSVRGRAVATLMLVAWGAAAWIAWRRGWGGGLRVSRPLVGAAAVVVGLAWLVALVPPWPGGLLVGIGGALLANGWWPRREPGVASPASIDVATATTIFRPPAKSSGSTAGGD